MSVEKTYSYARMPMSRSQYRYIKLTQQSGLQTATLTSAGGAESIFEFPIGIVNFSRSTLRFTLKPAVPTGANSHNWFWRNIFPASSIILETRSGLRLLSLDSNASTYTNMMVPLFTKFEDFLNFPRHSGSLGHGENFRATNNLISAIDLAKQPDNTNTPNNYTSICVCEQGGQGTQTPVLSFNIHLSRFVETILSLDKDIPLKELLQLRIVWAQTAYIGWYSVANDNPASTPTSISGDIAMTNLQLYACYQEAPIAVTAINAMVNNGSFKLDFPYPVVQNLPLSSVSQTAVFRFATQYGRKLKYIVHSLYHTTRGANTCYDHEGSKVTSFQTFLNDAPLNGTHLLTRANDDDYLMLSDFLKGKMAGESNEYAYHYAWIERFCDNVNGEYIDDSAWIIPPGEHQWQFVATTANASHNHFTSAIFEKSLIVTPLGFAIL